MDTARFLSGGGEGGVAVPIVRAFMLYYYNMRAKVIRH